MSRRASKGNDKIALPITPMLDMTFQLLFFFIMNFNPADLEGQIDAAMPSLPDSEWVRPIVGGAPAGNAPLVIPSDLTVEIRTRQVAGAGGGISDITVLGLTGRRVTIDWEKQELVIE